MQIDSKLTPQDLNSAVTRTFDLAAAKVRDIDRTWDPAKGTPVFTIDGHYTTRGWTEWTQGFQYGCALLTFDATDDRDLLDLGRRRTLERMAPHVTHTGVHDHGFNNLSTYGNLLRLMHEGRTQANEWERRFYELAIKASGAVQAARWAGVPVRERSKWSADSPSLGYVYSFNGPHSLFIDTMRTVRILGAAWQLGQPLMHEGDRSANLLKRSVLHGLTSSQFLIFHGDSEQTYDVRGRTAHEAVFNRNDGAFRNRSTQQGYSPFSTWTRGLAWAMLGYAEELEFFATIADDAFESACGPELAAHGFPKQRIVSIYESAARATCDHYINDCTAADGVPYWDDGAPELHKLGDWRERNSEPYNDHEPVDSSAAAIAAQGLIRLGRYLQGKNDAEGGRYFQAGLTVARTLMAEPYLSTSGDHQGLLLHSVYHRPNGWDHIPAGRNVPCDESSMWGDYHLLEAAHLIQRLAKNETYPTFFLM